MSGADVRRRAFLVAAAGALALALLLVGQQVISSSTPSASWGSCAPLLILAVALLQAPPGAPQPPSRPAPHAVVCGVAVALILTVGSVLLDRFLPGFYRAAVLVIAALFGLCAGVLSLLEHALRGRRRGASVLIVVGTLLALLTAIGVLGQSMYWFELGQGGSAQAAFLKTLGRFRSEIGDSRVVAGSVIPLACGAQPFFLIARRRWLGFPLTLAANAAGVSAIVLILWSQEVGALPILAGLAYPIAFRIADAAAADPDGVSPPSP